MSHQASLRRSSTISFKRAGARGRSRYFHLVKTKGKNIECVAQTRTEITFRLGSSKTRRSLWGKNPIRPCVEIRTDPAGLFPPPREGERDGRESNTPSEQAGQPDAGSGGGRSRFEPRWSGKDMAGTCRDNTGGGASLDENRCGPKHVGKLREQRDNLGR